MAHQEQSRRELLATGAVAFTGLAFGDSIRAEERATPRSLPDIEKAMCNALESWAKLTTDFRAGHINSRWQESRFGVVCEALREALGLPDGTAVRIMPLRAKNSNLLELTVWAHPLPDLRTGLPNERGLELARAVLATDNPSKLKQFAFVAQTEKLSKLIERVSESSIRGRGEQAARLAVDLSNSRFSRTTVETEIRYLDDIHTLLPSAGLTLGDGKPMSHHNRTWEEMKLARSVFYRGTLPSLQPVKETLAKIRSTHEALASNPIYEGRTAIILAQGHPHSDNYQPPPRFLTDEDGTAEEKFEKFKAEYAAIEKVGERRFLPPIKEAVGADGKLIWCSPNTTVDEALKNLSLAIFRDKGEAQFDVLRKEVLAGLGREPAETLVVHRLSAGTVQITVQSKADKRVLLEVEAKGDQERLTSAKTRKVDASIDFPTAAQAKEAFLKAVKDAPPSKNGLIIQYIGEGSNGPNMAVGSAGFLRPYGPQSFWHKEPAVYVDIKEICAALAIRQQNEPELEDKKNIILCMTASTVGDSIYQFLGSSERYKIELPIVAIHQFIFGRQEGRDAGEATGFMELLLTRKDPMKPLTINDCMEYEKKFPFRMWGQIEVLRRSGYFAPVNGKKFTSRKDFVQFG